jgi:hypothetical protein
MRYNPWLGIGGNWLLRLVRPPVTILILSNSAAAIRMRPRERGDGVAEPRWRPCSSSAAFHSGSFLAKASVSHHSSATPGDFGPRQFHQHSQTHAVGGQAPTSYAPPRICGGWPVCSAHALRRALPAPFERRPLHNRLVPVGATRIVSRWPRGSTAATSRSGQVRHPCPHPDADRPSVSDVRNVSAQGRCTKARRGFWVRKEPEKISARYPRARR